MKGFKRIIALILALAFIFSFATINASAESNPFTLSVGTVKSFTKDGYAYKNWVWVGPGDYDYEPVDATADLYTVTIPYGTNDVSITTEDNHLAYNYDVYGSYIAGNYADGGITGEKTSTVNVDSNEDGVLDYIWIQDLYNTDWSGGALRYVIKFEYSYIPTVSVAGTSITDFDVSIDGYTDSWSGTVNLYTYTIPNDTTSVKIDFTGDVTTYNYTSSGDFIGPYYEDYTTRFTTVDVNVDSNNDGEMDVIYVQIPYETDNSGGNLLYVITFEYENESNKNKGITEEKTLDKIYQETQEFMNSAVETSPTYDIAQYVLNLARANYDIDDKVVEDFISSVAKDGLDNASNPVYLILAVSALGYDATDVNGVNLIEEIKNLDTYTSTGYSATEAYYLIAADSADYWSDIKSLKGDATADAIIKDILSQQLDDGIWGFGTTPDIDTTAMVVQGLAPYYSSNSDVKKAIDAAVKYLASKQVINGDIVGDWGASSYTDAEVILALCSVGINPNTDSRFVKNGGSLLDALLRYYVSAEKAFGDPIATYESFQALNAYYRLVDGEVTFFDLSDVNFTDLVSNTTTGDVSNSSSVPVVEVTADRGVVPANTVLSVKVSDVDKGSIKLTDGKTVYAVFDISLLKDGKHVEPDGTVTVKIAIPDDLKNVKNLGIVWVKDDGTTVDMNAKRVDDSLIFDSTHFSNYAFVGDDERIADTGDNSPIFATVTLLCSSAFGIVVLRKKIQEN